MGCVVSFVLFPGSGTDLISIVTDCRFLRFLFMLLRFLSFSFSHCELLYQVPFIGLGVLKFY